MEEGREAETLYLQRSPVLPLSKNSKLPPAHYHKLHPSPKSSLSHLKDITSQFPPSGQQCNTFNSPLNSIVKQSFHVSQSGHIAHRENGRIPEENRTVKPNIALPKTSCRNHVGFSSIVNEFEAQIRDQSNAVLSSRNNTNLYPSDKPTSNDTVLSNSKRTNSQQTKDNFKIGITSNSIPENTHNTNAYPNVLESNELSKHNDELRTFQEKQKEAQTDNCKQSSNQSNPHVLQNKQTPPQSSTPNPARRLSSPSGNRPRYPSIQEESDEYLSDDSEVCLPNGVGCMSCTAPQKLTSSTVPLQQLNGGNNPHTKSIKQDASGGSVKDRRNNNKQSANQESTLDDNVSASSSTASLTDIHVHQVVGEISRTNSDNSGKVQFRSIIYIMALSLHGIFEGMALGLQTSQSSVWALCFAIVVHRCVLSFKLGMDLCRGAEKQGTSFLCIGTFTLISTLGIVIGIIISSGASLYDDVTVPEAVLQCLATGTIFYIVFFDIFFKDLEGKNDLKRVSCSFVGFVTMAIIFAVAKS